MWRYHGDWGWGWWVFGMVAFWGIVIWAAVSLLRGGDRGAEPGRRSPEDIGGERLARGEIGEDEHRRLVDAPGATTRSIVNDETGIR